MKIRNVIVVIAAGIIATGVLLYIKGQKKLILEANERVQKLKSYYKVYNQWIKNNIDHYSIEKAMLDHGYRTISIYGNGEIGSRLYEELKGTEVKVSCFIDKKADDFTRYNEDGIVVRSIEDVGEYSNVDAIIVTTVNIFEEIEKKLLEKGVQCNIISLEDLLIR